jgi:hypothetical protein
MTSAMHRRFARRLLVFLGRKRLDDARHDEQQHAAPRAFRAAARELVAGSQLPPTCARHDDRHRLSSPR